MDDLSIAKCIIESYDEITNVEQSVGELDYITFEIGNHRFLVWFIDPKVSSYGPIVFAVDYEDYDFPHIMTDVWEVPKEKAFPEGKYRSLCLYEAGSIVRSLYSFEEKIIDTVDRLLKLLKLTQIEIERELQKEFLLYWNEVARTGEIDIYLENTETYTGLNVYISKEGLRCVAPGIKLNDKEKQNENKLYWEHMTDIAACYIPIIDNRGILPPTKSTAWSMKNILEIVYGKQINHIAHKDFIKITNEQIKAKKLILSFGMKVNGVRKIFSILISFKSSNKNTMLNKLQNDVFSFELIMSKRIDYKGLSEAIGNDMGLLKRRALIVGVGSLGSYVASEMVKNGFNQITVYDGDKLEADNIMRWAYGGFCQGVSKTVALKMFLEHLHPEIMVNAIGKDLDREALEKEIDKNDVIIFTVGNSDTQLFFNDILKERNCQIPVIYTWIEAGGEYSHILKILYSKKGCFRCLYTDKDGNPCNNKENILKEDQQEQLILRNGCGGTRAPYGTAVLLRTTAALLSVIQNVFAGDEEDNYLINISKNNIQDQKLNFYERMCNCCGDT